MHVLMTNDFLTLSKDNTYKVYYYREECHIDSCRGSLIVVDSQGEHVNIPYTRWPLLCKIIFHEN